MILAADKCAERCQAGAAVQANMTSEVSMPTRTTRVTRMF